MVYFTFTFEKRGHVERVMYHVQINQRDCMGMGAGCRSKYRANAIRGRNRLTCAGRAWVEAARADMVARSSKYDDVC